MKRKRISLLHAKYLRNSLTEDETIEWSDALNDPANEELLKSLMADTWAEVAQGKKTDMPSQRSDKILANITGSLSLIKLKPKKTTYWIRISVAASVLLIASLGLFVYNAKFSAQTKAPAGYTNDVAPGRNGATLTLANGQKIRIKDAMAGNIATQSGVKISKAADGQIIYAITNHNSGEIAYNTLSTTRGEQIQVRLPDGTLVFLNAESSLRYPISFAKSEKRQVDLTGEGYFEVTKDRLHPFIVKSENQLVEVLGTHFNINSYADERDTKTTLLEGSVKITAAHGPLTIRPGQQAVLQDGNLSVNKANVDEAVAWKNGEFVFNDKSIPDIMKQVARWYGVRIVFNDQVSESYLTGSVSRNRKLSQVLKMMEKTKEVKFRIDGGTIYVNKYN